LILWNRTHSATELHVTKLNGPSENPDILAEAERDLSNAVSGANIIWTCFAGQAAVLEVFDQILLASAPKSVSDGYVEKLLDLKGKLFVECSTMSAETTDELSKRIMAAGGEFVGMPSKLLSFQLNFFMILHFQNFISLNILTKSSLWRAKHGKQSNDNCITRRPKSERAKSSPLS
jgi:hypothetical protein